MCNKGYYQEAKEKVYLKLPEQVNIQTPSKEVVTHRERKNGE